MADMLVTESDILNDIVNTIAPKYFPDTTLDNNRVSVFGFISETMSKSVSDTMILEQRRAEDFIPELSNSEVKVKQTAQTRGLEINDTVPGSCYAMIGVIKDDILEKGTVVGNEIDFTIDRRSTILYNNINFSLEDNIIIRAIKKTTGTYTYTANYTGEYSTGTTLNIQSFDQTNSNNEDMVVMICKIYQYNYNIQDKIVTDDLEFLYDGIEFDYDHYLAGFNIYYKQSTSTDFTQIDSISYYTTTTNSDKIYYDSTDSNILYIYNNPNLNISTNATIRVEIKETLGTDGNLNITDADVASFSMYKDASYNYSGINISIILLSDISGAVNELSLSDIKQELINEKVRRDNITTENDIIQYINDNMANVQIVKKRNDTQDRIYYLYTLLRYDDNKIVPTTTKTLKVTNIKSPTDFGDFDEYHVEDNRKIIRSYNKFKIISGESTTIDDDYVIKTTADENETNSYYLTCPYMILINSDNIASYYFTSVNETVSLSSKTLTDPYSYRMICNSFSIYRDSHNPYEYNKYKFSISGTLNITNDSEFIDDTGNVINSESIMCYVIFNTNGSPSAYLPMSITGYDKTTREFTFSSSINTTDYITVQDTLEISNGLYGLNSDTVYNSVIDFKDAQLQIYFLYKTDDTSEYARTDDIYGYVPDDKISNYIVMSGYYNTTDNLYNMILEFNKFSRSPVTMTVNLDATITYTIKEVPFFEYSYGIENTVNMYDTFYNMLNIYSSLIKLTTDFEIALKFIATYGNSKYITVTGGRDSNGNEIEVNLNNLTPSFYFKVYGSNPSISDIYTYIYEYLRDTYITENTIFISNICTAIEQNFASVKSIKYMGIDTLDASYQEFTYHTPTFDNLDAILSYIPEQFNVTNIQITLDET